MTRAIFTPLGEQARWRTVYDLLVQGEVDQIVTYETAAAALELHPTDNRAVISAAFRDAGKRFLRDHDHAIEAVPNVGYRIVTAREHMRLAKGHQVRSNRALSRGRTTVEHVDLNGLDVETQRAFRVVAQAFAAQMEFNRRIDVRQRRLEQNMAAMKVSRERTDEEIAALRERLARLETAQSGSTTA